MKIPPLRSVHLLIATLILALPIGLKASGKSDFKVIPYNKQIECSPLSFLQEGQQALSAKMVSALYHEGRFRKVEGNFVNFGRSYSRYWMHFRISTAHNPAKLMLELDNAHIYRLQVFAEVNGRITQLYRTGSELPFCYRPFNYRNFIFPLDLAEKQFVNYYILLDRRDEVMKFSLNLYDQSYFMHRYNLNYWFYGGFTGTLLFIMLFSVFLMISLRAEIHGWYVLYLALVLSFVLADTGLAYEFIWGDYPTLNKHARTLLGMLAFMVQLQFMQSFISQTRLNSSFFKWVNLNKLLFMVLSVLLVLIISFKIKLSFSFFKILQIGFYTAYITGIILVFFSLTEKIRQRNKVAMIYLFAILTLLLQIIIVILARWHLLNVAIDTSLTMSCCIMAEVIILTLGLTFRYNHYKKEKNKLELRLAVHQNLSLIRIMDALEEEKKRIAEDLHDDVGGTLSVVKGMLSYSETLENKSLEQKLIKSQDLLDQACKDLRLIAHDLMPPSFHLTSLDKAVEEAVSKANMASTKTVFSYLLNGKTVVLDKQVELHIFRILNELIQNVRKHAQASIATIQLTYYPSSLQIMVEDNGCGLGVSTSGEDRRGIGLRNLRSRAEYIRAEVHVDTGQHGTTIICNVPY